MAYGLLADGVMVVHLAFILFVALGGLLALRWPGVVWLHLPAALWGAVIEWMGWVCPLTPLEHRLRLLGSGTSYEGGFLDHYLVPLIYPPGLTRMMQVALGFGVVVLNVAIYVWVWRRRRSTPRPA